MKKALELYNSANVSISGPVSSVHTFIDMSTVTVAPQWTGLKDPVTTCESALGDSFAGGSTFQKKTSSAFTSDFLLTPINLIATDGPGDFNFVQGTNNTSTNEYWNFIAS